MTPEIQNSQLLANASITHVSVTISLNNPLLGNGPVSTFPWLRINTKENNRRTVKYCDLYSHRPEVIKGSVHSWEWAAGNFHSYFVTFQETIFFIASGVGLSPLYRGHFWPIVPAPDDRWGWLWSNWWNKDWQGKPKYSEKTCPSTTLSTTNPTWPTHPGRRGGKPSTNRLNYGAA
jgi:hypothetical protein